MNLFQDQDQHQDWEEIHFWKEPVSINEYAKYLKTITFLPQEDINHILSFIPNHQIFEKRFGKKEKQKPKVLNRYQQECQVIFCDNQEYDFRVRSDCGNITYICNSCYINSIKDVYDRKGTSLPSVWVRYRLDVTFLPKKNEFSKHKTYTEEKNGGFPKKPRVLWGRTKTFKLPAK